MEFFNYHGNGVWLKCQGERVAGDMRIERYRERRRGLEQIRDRYETATGAHGKREIERGYEDN